MIIDFRNINGGGGSGYTLPVATDTILGGVKVGSGLTITSGGTLSADAQPVGIATTAQTGVVKIGDGINVDSAGTISVDQVSGDVMLPMGHYINDGGVDVPSMLNVNKGFSFTAYIGEDEETGDHYDNYVFNPYFKVCTLNGVAWNNSAYLDFYVIKASENNYATVKLILSNSIGNGNVNTTLIEETWDLETETTFQVPTFTVSGYITTEDLVVEGFQFTLSNEFVGPKVTFSMPIDKNDQSLTFINYCFVPSDALTYSTHISTIDVSKTGWSMLATSGTAGVVKVGSGLSISNSGVLSVSGGTGGDSTKLISVNTLPTGATEGDVVSLFYTGVTESYCYVEVNGQVKTSNFTLDGGTVNIIKGNTLPSENLMVVGVEYWGDNYIYLTSAGTFILDGGIVDNNPIVIPESGWTREEDEYYFNVTPTSNGLDLTFTTEREFGVYYSVYPETMVKTKMYVWDSHSKTCDIKQISQDGQQYKTIVTYFGELPQNQIIFAQNHSYWGEYWYWVFDGTDIKAYVDTGLTDYRGVVASFEKAVEGSKFTDGLIDFVAGLPWTLSTYGNWSDAGNGHWKPVDYETIKNNAFQVLDTTVQQRIYAPGVADFLVAGYDGSMIELCLPSGYGISGQVLVSNGYESAAVWVNKETITNGVKFWKGTQAEYDAMSGTGYDNSTLYIITDTPNAV